VRTRFTTILPRLPPLDPAGMLPGMGKKARQETPSAAVSRWRINLLKGTPAKFLGYADTHHEKAAIETAAKEFKIAQALRDRIVAQRDEL
jgi:hypothetical protein